MRIDLHTHTQNLKKGDGPGRVISPEDYVGTMLKEGVGIASITNHNKFDLEEFNEVSRQSDDLMMFPGIELDVKIGDKRRQVIIIANPSIKDTFSEVYNDPDRDHEKYCIEYDQFINLVKRFKVDDVIIVPHFYNKDNGITISEKDELCKDLEGYTVIVEPANLVSMTIINSNEDYLSLVGSDVQDWSKYSSSMALEIKFDIDSFSKFYELAREPKIFVKNALDGSESNSIKINNNGELILYDDLNIIFGEKGSGKTVLIDDYILPFYSDSGKKVVVHRGKESSDIYKDILKEYEDKVEIDSDLLTLIENKLSNMMTYSDPNPSDFVNKFMLYHQDKNKNKRAKCLKKTESQYVNNEYSVADSIIGNAEKDTASINKVIDINDKVRGADSDDGQSLKSALNKLKRDVLSIASNELKKLFISEGIESIVNTFKESVNKKTGKMSRPNGIGFSKLVAARLKRSADNKDLIQCMQDIQLTEPMPLGVIPVKGALIHETSICCLTERDLHKEDSVFDRSRIKANRELVRKINSFNKDSFKSIDSYFSPEEKSRDVRDIVKDIIKKNSVIKLSTGQEYKPSDGERAILSISSLLENNSYDVYLFDEIERGLGHKYIADYLIPKLKQLRDMGKIIVLSTHDANIAINTLPSQTIYCDYPSENIYYGGNMYSNEIIGIVNGHIKNWRDTAIIHLDGGEKLFNSRSNIYEK